MGGRGLVTGDTDKDEVLKATFTSDFTGKSGLQQSQVPETRGEVM